MCGKEAITYANNEVNQHLVANYSSTYLCVVAFLLAI